MSIECRVYGILDLCILLCTWCLFENPVQPFHHIVLCMVRCDADVEPALYLV